MTNQRFAIRNAPRAKPDDRPQDDRYLVQSVLRATTLLREFESAEALSVGQLAVRLGLPKPTVFRLAVTLAHAGFLERRDDASLVLGPRLVSIARLIFGRGLPVAARPSLEKLFRAVGHSVNLAVLDGDSVLYVDAIDSGEGLRMVGVIGDREPFNATAVGKAMAAALSPEALERLLTTRSLQGCTPNTITSPSQLEDHLRDVRKRGYAVDDGENVTGGRCVGAAISDVNKVVGGISVSAPASTLHVDDIPRIAALVIETAEAIGSSLASQPRPARGVG